MSQIYNMTGIRGTKPYYRWKVLGKICLIKDSSSSLPSLSSLWQSTSLCVMLSLFLQPITEHWYPCVLFLMVTIFTISLWTCVYSSLPRLTRICLYACLIVVPNSMLVAEAKPDYDKQRLTVTLCPLRSVVHITGTHLYRIIDHSRSTI